MNLKKIREYPLDGQLIEAVRNYISLNLSVPEQAGSSAVPARKKRFPVSFGAKKTADGAPADFFCVKEETASPDEADAAAQSCEAVPEAKIRPETNRAEAAVPPDTAKKEKAAKACLNSIPADIDDISAFLEDGFPLTLMKLIDKKGRTDVDVYKKAGCSKQTWYKIMNDANYKPSKKTAVAFSLSLELSFPEAQALLGSAGYTLSRSSVSDIIVEYCLNNRIYSLIEVDAILFRFDQETIGSKL